MPNLETRRLAQTTNTAVSKPNGPIASLLSALPKRTIDFGSMCFGFHTTLATTPLRRLSGYFPFQVCPCLAKAQT